MDEINDLIKRVYSLDPQTQEIVLSFLDLLIKAQRTIKE